MDRYLARVEARERKKEASGAAQAERETRERADMIGAMYMDVEMDAETESQAGEDERAAVDGALDALFGGGYSFGDEPDLADEEG